MSFSGGTFSINSSGQPVVTGTVISSTAFNALTADLATGLSTAVLKDGTQTLTASLPMAGFILTGLGAGASAGNSLRYEQLFTAGTVTMLGNLSVPGTALVTGVATLTAKPILSSLTASTGVLADSGKGLVSAAAPIVNTLSGDVTLNNTSNYFLGPTCAQGTTGTWWAAGTVVVTDSNGAATFSVKLWDGTTVIASAVVRTTGAGTSTSCALAGFLASPAGNIRISVKDSTSTGGTLQYNGSGESKDATLSVIQIA